MERQFIQPIQAFRCLTSLFDLARMGFNITKVTLDHIALITSTNTSRKA